MPDKETYDRIVAFEDALARIERRGESCLVYYFMGNGRIKWHWYIQDKEMWALSFAKLLPEWEELFPIEMACSYNPDWSEFHEFVSRSSFT